MEKAVDRILGGGYTIKGSKKNVVRCTELLKKFHNDFDPDYILRNKTKKESEVLKKQWNDTCKDASDKGTDLHAEIEEYLKGNINISTDICFNYFLNFMKDNSNIKPYKIEWIVCEPWLLIAGTIDAIFKDNQTGQFIMIDWKRSKDIKHSAFQGETCKYPLYHLYDCNFTKYALQLNLYRWILKSVYSINIQDLWLVILHPNNKDYIKEKVPLMEREIEYIIQIRIGELIQLGYPKNAFDKYIFRYSINDIKQGDNHKRLLKRK